MKQLKSIIYLAYVCISCFLAVSCSGNGEKIQALEAQRDSLALAANDANLRYNELSGLLGEISDCVDSVSMQSEIAFATIDTETGRVYSRLELRKRVANLVHSLTVSVSALLNFLTLLPLKIWIKKRWSVSLSLSNILTSNSTPRKQK